MDASTVDAVVSALTAAIGTYGREVLVRVEEAAGDATVHLGLRLLARLRRGEGKARAAVEEAVADVAQNPGDEDFQAALRAQVKKALSRDPELARDLAGLLREGGVTVTAAGDRAVAVGHNAGIVSTGDGAANRIER